MNWIKLHPGIALVATLVVLPALGVVIGNSSCFKDKDELGPKPTTSHGGYYIQVNPDGTVEPMPAPTVEDKVNRYLANYDSLLALRHAVYGRDSLAVQTGVYNLCGYALLEAIQAIEAASTSGGSLDHMYLADLAIREWAGRFHEYEKYRAMSQPNADGRNCERLNEMNTAYVSVLELGYGSYRRLH